jgi:small subunit ribosomal protein S17
LLEFRVLGSLEVADEGRPVTLRGVRQRALLALLLLHANEVVTEERLLDSLWGDEPPSSGRAALRVRVSQLRKALPAAALERAASGYVLRLEPEAVDSRRFEALLDEGMRARRAGEPRREPPAPEPKAGGRLKVRQGIVVSDKADKTITVRIDVARRHRMYKKIVRTSTMLHAHDERNEAGVGDTVRVIESRPLSRTKRWRLVEVLERAR